MKKERKKERRKEERERNQTTNNQTTKQQPNNQTTIKQQPNKRMNNTPRRKKRPRGRDGERTHATRTRRAVRAVSLVEETHTPTAPHLPHPHRAVGGPGEHIPAVGVEHTALRVGAFPHGAKATAQGRWHIAERESIRQRDDRTHERRHSHCPRHRGQWEGQTTEGGTDGSGEHTTWKRETEQGKQTDVRNGKERGRASCPAAAAEVGEQRVPSEGRCGVCVLAVPSTDTRGLCDGWA